MFRLTIFFFHFNSTAHRIANFIFFFQKRLLVITIVNTIITMIMVSIIIIFIIIIIIIIIDANNILNNVALPLARTVVCLAIFCLSL